MVQIEVTRKGADVRCIVINIKNARHSYERVRCVGGRVENLIRRHKSHLASARAGCRSPPTNQTRLILHSVA
jgi:hypothetical protein